MKGVRVAAIGCAALLLGSGSLLAPGCGGSDECKPLDQVLLDTPEGLAPTFQLPDVTCRTVSLAESNGQVRLIDFWATWCPPCREEIPMLNELNREYKDRGLTILAISDERSGIVRDFAEEAGMGYTNLIDPGDVGQAYRVVGLPTAFLIDRNGRIVDSYVGPKSRQRLEQQIRELLELPPAG